MQIRTVNYVLANGEVRPMILANAHGGKLNHIDGLVFLRESNADAGLLPLEVPAGEPYALLREVPEDSTKKTHTWHFPEEAN